MMMNAMNIIPITNIIHGDAVFADSDSFEAAAVEADTFVLVLAENHGFAIRQAEPSPRASTMLSASS